MNHMNLLASIQVDFVQGKARPRLGKYGVYTPRETLSAEKVIALTCKQQIKKPTQEPVFVLIETYRTIPASVPKKITEQPDIYKPDIDNIAKLVLDGLNGVAYFDDKQVTYLAVKKTNRNRENTEHMSIKIYEIK